MNSTQPESAGTNLTTPEQVVIPPEGGETLPTGETAAAPERTASPRVAAPPLATTIPLPVPQSPTGSVPVVNPAAATAASLMTDDDLIEKEWVNKAKQIVEKTRDDPYKQSEYMTVFKADYIKKHYGKTIKLSR